MSDEYAELSTPARGLHALAPWAWRLLILGMVLLAVYVAAGRLLMNQLSSLRDPLLAQLNQRLPFTVDVTQISGRWSAFSPEVYFSDLQLLIAEPDATAQPVVLGSGSLRVDVAASIASRSLKLSRLLLSDLALEARLGEAGVIEIAGFSGTGDGRLLEWLEGFLPKVERVELAQNRLRLALADRQIDLALDLVLEREGNARHLEGRLLGSELSLVVNAEGVGNPLRPLSWSGDVYVDARSDDLSAFAGLMESVGSPVRLAGSASAEFWLTRARGDSTARMRWTSEALQVEERHAAWSLPLDALSFEAALDQRARHWSLLTEDFHIERAGQALDLDRAQFDWWGQALRVRASDLSLAALPTLLAAAPGLPDGFRNVFPDLAPRGKLTAIELRLDDLARPGQSWQLRSTVEDLSIESWRNAPALAGVSGYLELVPGHGILQLDSRAFSMHFPPVYREPLTYAEALGSLRFDWDDAGLRIASDLMSLSTAADTASGLFAVDIPFVERVTGIELELLVGLQNSRLERHARYLPYKLPAPLLEWLDRSGASGDLVSGGFVYRGSLKRKNRPHKTVQLFLDATGAGLSYDPAWPPLRAADALVLIDDGRTTAWAASARSEGALLEDVALSLTPSPGKAALAIAGHVSGDAATAGVLLRDSPLREITNGVFADWTFDGAVSGELALRLQLGADPPPPELGLSLQMADVNATIAQLDLPLENVTGVLRYESAAGFAGSAASATALGGQLTVAAIDDNPEGIALDIASEAQAAAIAEWMQLPLLNMASGTASITGRLDVARGETAKLELQSQLLGVTLDVPRPYGKTSDQPLPLRIDVPLRSDPELTLLLGDRLQMQIQLAGSELRQLIAAVGGGSPDMEACDQRYCLSGTLSSLDIAAWNDFYRRYLAPPDGDLTATAPRADENVAATEDRRAERPFSYRIDSLKIGELRLGQRSLGRSRIDLWGIDRRWQGALESASVQGSLTRQDEELQLLVEYLDLDRFSGGEPAALADVVRLLPDMRVDILEVRRGEQLLGDIGFNLDVSTVDGALYAADIRGDMLGLRIDPTRAGMLRWSADKAGVERTELELDVAFDDLGDVLRAAGFAPTLESESGLAGLRIGWPGPPSEFAVNASSGALSMSARNGRVLESRPGALAMVSFLNLAEILRGLSLAHMFDAGIPFIDAQAEIFLHEGILEIADLQIDGAASAFAFHGVSDLGRGSIDGELVVTLPVANNLPWVAALAGGLPVAAGVFVVSKVFQKQVNRMSSAVYGVSGEIQAPDVEFRRLFDDKLRPLSPAVAPAVPADNETGAG